MQKRPLVSIIVPCFNQGSFLSDALNSVFGQSYINWECIIVDDGSTDDTKEVAENWCGKDSRFNYFYKKNGGVSSARNIGIRKSKGDLILPLDADDKIAPDYLSLAVEAFKMDPNLKLVYSEAEKFGLENEYWALPEYCFENQMLGNHIFSAAFFKRVDFDKIGGYNEKMKDGYEDWDFWLSLLEKNDKVFRIPKVLFYYRIKESSRDRNMLAANKHKEMQLQLFLNHHQAYFEVFGDPISLIINNKFLRREINQTQSLFWWKVFNRITQILRKKI